MDSAPLFFRYPPSFLCFVLLCCGELFVTNSKFKNYGFLNIPQLDVGKMFVSRWHSSRFNPSSHNHGSVENGGPKRFVWFFSTSMMSREEGRVKSPWHHTLAPCCWRVKAALFALLSPKVRTFRGGNCWGRQLCKTKTKKLARKGIFRHWNLLYTYRSGSWCNRNCGQCWDTPIPTI